MSDRQLYTYDYIDASLTQLSAILREDLAGWMGASDQDDALLARVSAPLAGFDVGREVRIEVGAMQEHDDDRVTLPLEWDSVTSSGAFPHMDARLEVAEISADPPVCQIMFFGTYEPPGGRLGAAGDALLLHRVAEATVHRFLRQVATRLRAAVTEAGPSSGRSDQP